MAKKKTVEADAIEATALETEITEAVNAPEATEQEVTEAPVKEVKSKKTATTQVSSELPDNVKDLLRVFNNYPELYVAKNGAVFTPDTQLSQVKEAILYKNPFYKS